MSHVLYIPPRGEKSGGGFPFETEGDKDCPEESLREKEILESDFFWGRFRSQWEKVGRSGKKW
jgi:hypothetical protein